VQRLGDGAEKFVAEMMTVDIMINSLLINAFTTITTNRLRIR